jgi:hypothetical protein
MHPSKLKNTRWIFIKFNAGEFYDTLSSYFNFNFDNMFNDDFTWRFTCISACILLNIKRKMLGMNVVEKNKTPFYILYTFFVSRAVLEIINLYIAELIILRYGSM